MEKVETTCFRETGMLTRMGGMHRANSLFRLRLEVRAAAGLRSGGSVCDARRPSKMLDIRLSSEWHIEL